MATVQSNRGALLAGQTSPSWWLLFVGVGALSLSIYADWQGGIVWWVGFVSVLSGLSFACPTSSEPDTPLGVPVIIIVGGILLDQAGKAHLPWQTTALFLVPASIPAIFYTVDAIAGWFKSLANPSVSAQYKAQKRQQAQSQLRAVEQSRRATQSAASESASNEQNYPVTTPSITFKDIVGMDDVKKRLLAAGTKIVESYNAGSGAKPRNGILLHGEPGNGKTMFGESLAGELRLPYLYATFGTVASRFVNQTTEQVMQVMASARRQAPCVLFLDEIDSLIADRNKAQNSDSESTRTTNAILTEIVNLRGSGVVLVAATNFLERLDEAAIREGRFDFKVEITPPDLEARKAIILRAIGKSFAEEVAARQLNLPKPKADQEGFELIAKRWDGFSASRMAAIGAEVAELAVNERLTLITFDHFMTALRAVQGRAGRLPANTPLLDDLSMAKSVKEQLGSLLARMTHIDEIERLGGAVPSGVLFAGPARTGKTTGAMSLAKTAQWAFIGTSGTDLIQSPEKMEAIFKEASELRPCVLFIDEGDDLLKDRRYSNAGMLTNKFLTLMDGARKKASDVLVVVATNFPDQLDPAVLGGGRLTEKVYFEVADNDQALTSIKAWRRSLKVQIHDDVSDEWLLQQMKGKAIGNIGATLQAAVDRVATRSVIGGNAIISRDDILAAIQILDI